MHNKESGEKCDLLKIFMRSIPLAAAMLDRDMRYIAVTDRWLEEFNMAGQVLIGRSHYDVFPEARRSWEEVYTRCMAGAREIREADPVYREDGSVRWFRWEVMPWLGDGRTVGGLIVSVEDVTERKNAMDAVLRSEARFQKLFEFAPDGVIILNGRHEIERVNDQLLNMTGYSRGELIQQPIEKLLPREYWGETGLRAEHELGSSEVFCRRKDGTVCPADVRVKFFETDEVEMVLCVIRDITERRKAENSQRLATAVLENTTEGIIVTNAEGVIQSVNKAFTQITGYSASEAVGEKMQMLKSEVQDEVFYASAWKVLRETGAWKGRLWNRRKNGEVYPQETTINEIRNNRGDALLYCGIFRDVTEQMKFEETLRVLATTDSLTGLANRRSFNEAIALEWRRALRAQTPLALIMADIDNFKKLNDRYGHPAGDECLRKIGAVLNKVVRRAGNLAARYGGEEFALLLPATNRNEAIKTADQVKKEVELIRLVPEGSRASVSVTLSMGIAAAVPNRSGSVNGLISAADRALYQAKQTGRNRIVSAA